VIRMRLMLARLSNSWILDRGIAEALNIGLRALPPNRRGSVSSSTGPHRVWAKLVNLCRGPAQAMELRISISKNP